MHGQRPCLLHGERGTVSSLKTGDTFQVSFSENPAIPLRWQVNASPGLAVINESYRVDLSIGDIFGMVGGSRGTKTWDMQVVQAGTWTLEMDQVRLNAAPGQSALVRTINVTIIATDR